MGSLGNLFFKIGADVREAISAIQKVEGQIQRTAKSFGSLGKGLLAGFSAAGLFEIGKQAVQASNEFERAFLRIKNLTDSATKDIDLYQRSIGKIATTAGVSINDLANGLYDITSSGLSGAKALETLEIAAKGAAIGMGSTQEIAKSITGVLNSYSSTNLTAARAAEILFNTTKQGAIDINELTTSLSNVTPLASALGVNLEQVGAFLATVSLQGTRASEGVTQLASILNAIINPTSEAKQILDSIGISLSDLQKVVSSDLRQGLLLLEKGFDGNTEAMAKFFGRKEAVIGFLSAVGANSAKYGQILSGNIALTKNFENASEESLSTLDAKWKKFTASMSVAWNALGDSIKGILLIPGEIIRTFKELGNLFFPKADQDLQRLKQINEQAKQLENINKGLTLSGKDAKVPIVSSSRDATQNIIKDLDDIFNKLNQNKDKKLDIVTNEELAQLDLARVKSEEAAAAIDRTIQKANLPLTKFEQNLFKQEKIFQPTELAPLPKKLLPEDGIQKQIDALKTSNDAFNESLSETNDELGAIGSAAVSAFAGLAAGLLDGSIAFKDLGRAALQAAGQIIKAALAEALAAGIAKPIKNNPNVLVGIAIAGIAVAAILSLFKSKVPKLAKGGLAYGPQLAVVGDNPNASRDPEVISPLSKLRDMITGEMFKMTAMMANAMDAALSRASVEVPSVQPNAIQSAPQEIIIKGQIDGSVIRLAYDRSASTQSKFQPNYY